MDAFLRTSTNREQSEPMEPVVKWSPQEDPTTQLIEHDFREHENLLRKCIEYVTPRFHIEPEVFVHGKNRNQPRDVWFGSDKCSSYPYSGRQMKAEPLGLDLTALIRIVNEQLGTSYNSVLVNRYKNGKKTVGAHRDSEKGVHLNKGVFAITWGATRKFRIRNYVTAGTGAILADVPARHAYGLRMKGGNFQKNYTHEIPPEGTVHGERISITFRQHDVDIFDVSERKRKRDEDYDPE